MKRKVWAFLLPAVPWLVLGVPYVAGWLYDDPWLGFFMAIFLLIPSVVLFLVLGAAGLVCAVPCYRDTKQKRYWLALALGVGSVCYGLVQLVWLLSMI